MFFARGVDEANHVDWIKENRASDMTEQVLNFTVLYPSYIFRLSNSRPVSSINWRSQIEPGSIWARVG